MSTKSLFSGIVAFLAMSALFAFTAEPAVALDTRWTAGTGSWHEAGNWDNGIPTSSAYAYIDNGGTAQITTEVFSSCLYLGYDDLGAVVQTGGINTIVGTGHYDGLHLGYNPGSSGTYNLSGMGQLSAESEYIGYYGTGVFNQTGGTNTVTNYLYFGYSGGNGTYNLSGTGQLSAGYEHIGHSGTSKFNQTGGTNTITGFLYLGTGSTSGTYNLSGGQLSVGYDEYIGNYGTGEFKQDGGTHTVDEYLYLGLESGSSGTYNLSGTGQLSASHEYIGIWGTGEFNQTGGTNTITGFLLGYYPGSSGTYNLSAGQFSVGYNEGIGYGGPGEFNQTGGTHTIGYYLFLGCESGSSGTYNLSAGQLSVDGNEYIGYEGTGEFNQDGGTHTVDSVLYLGDDSGSSGEYNLYGGFLAMGDLYINNGWMDIDISAIDAFTVSGDKVGLLDGYIADGKIFDSTLCPDGYLYAIYDPDNDWTTLEAIPEPGTLLLLAPGLFGIAGVLRRRRR